MINSCLARVWLSLILLQTAKWRLVLTDLFNTQLIETTFDVVGVEDKAPADRAEM